MSRARQYTLWRDNVEATSAPTIQAIDDLPASDVLLEDAEVNVDDLPETFPRSTPCIQVNGGSRKPAYGSANPDARSFSFSSSAECATSSEDDVMLFGDTDVAMESNDDHRNDKLTGHLPRGNTNVFYSQPANTTFGAGFANNSGNGATLFELLGTTPPSLSSSK